METTGGRDRIDRSGSVDSHFNIPKKVIDISKMSSLDRKTLAMRLRSDLVRTRSVLNIIQLRHPNTASHASSSSPSSASPKKQGAPGPSGSRVKGGHTIRFESYKAPPVPASNPEALWMKQCETLLERLMSHKHAWIFSEPVDAVKFKIPDYYDVIKHPMDLGTIKSNIDSGAYKNPWDFAADVRLTFANAMRYNPPHNNVHGMADTMRKLFETRWKPIQKKLCAAVPNFKRETEAAESPVDHNIVVTEKVNQKMTNEEKQNLDSRLMSLSGDLPRDVVNLLWQRSEIENREDQEKEIDIFRLRDDTLFELQKLLDKNLLEKQKIQQVMNVSGLRNPSTYPSRSNEPSEENVDICGNSPLIPTDPYTGNEPSEENVDICGNSPLMPNSPVFIEKAAKHGNGNNSSSSYSSSDSDSSSRDSDSGSSSGSESHESVADPVKTSKENIVTQLALNQEKSDVITVAPNIPLHKLDSPEQDTHSKPAPLGKLDSPEQDTHSKPAPVGTNVHAADSDSGSSSGSESHERVASPMKTSKENIITELALNQEKRDVITVAVNIPLGKLDSPEQDTHSKPAPVGTNVHAADSDSGSSSGSESHERVASHPMKTSKENIITELALNQEKRDVITVAANIPLSKLDSPEQDTHSKPAPVGTNVHAEGENANSERQVSQEQLFRAALLKRRYADTILKAHEKTITMCARGDPEKLQYEREEFERQQKEETEKARLIAEAKAAEEAEAKRQLQLQRKAAREALERIEKTVEFNDSLIDYLEFLRTSCVEDHTASFKIDGDKPLEQLGLFLKKDNEEEEEEDN